jgi:hypothetical protein
MNPQQPWRKPTVLNPTMRFFDCEMRAYILSLNGEYFFYSRRNYEKVFYI